jgi:hypothetical protein
MRIAADLPERGVINQAEMTVDECGERLLGMFLDEATQEFGIRWHVSPVSAADFETEQRILPGNR